MGAARARNAVAALAIALTTVLFTSLFTIAASINYSYQQENFRRAGSDAHGSFKDVTWEQAEQLRQDPLRQIPVLPQIPQPPVHVLPPPPLKSFPF